LAKSALLEEPSHADAEVFQDPGEDQFFLGSKSPRRVVGAEDVRDLGFGVKDDHDQDAGIQVFRNFS